MEHTEGEKPPHLPVADEAWAAAVELTGEEPWLTTEPQLGLDGEPDHQR